MCSTAVKRKPGASGKQRCPLRITPRRREGQRQWLGANDVACTPERDNSCSLACPQTFQLCELTQSLVCFSWFAFGSQSLEIKLSSNSAVLRATAQRSLRSVGNELLNS